MNNFDTCILLNNWNFFLMNNIFEIKFQQKRGIHSILITSYDPTITLSITSLHKQVYIVVIGLFQQFHDVWNPLSLGCCVWQRAVCLELYL
jgi:hypothetical protein